MKYFVLFFTLLLGCSTQEPSSTTVDAAAPQAKLDTTPKVVHPNSTLRRRPRVALAPPKPDPRTSVQIAQAACAGHCTAPVRKFGAGTRPPIVPATWTVPAWYFDYANATGCASDNNTCTSASCGAGGVGPCMTVNEVVARWGTTQPILPQSVTFYVLSSETLGAESIVLNPVVVDGSVFGIVGTPKQVTSFALGTVTPKNRIMAQRLTAGGFTAGSITSGGQLVVNTSRSSSRAFTNGVAAGVATLTQPLAQLSIADAFAYVPPVPAEDNTWTAGDTVVVDSLPMLNIKELHVLGGDVAASAFTGGVTWVQYITIPDNTGTSGNSVFSLGSIDNVYLFADSSVGPYIAFNPLGDDGISSSIMYGCYLGGGTLVSFGSLIGGAVESFGASIGEYGAVDGDLQTVGLFSYTGNGFMGQVYAGSDTTSDAGTVSSVQIGNNSAPKLDNVYYPVAVSWGPGSVNIGNVGSLENGSGQTWQQALLNRSGIFLDGETTGTGYTTGPATWTSGLPLNPASLDVYGSLQDPNTHEIYVGQPDSLFGFFQFAQNEATTPDAGAFAATFGSTTVAGDWIAVIAANRGSTGVTFTSVTDSQGNAYSAATGTTLSVGLASGIEMQAFYAGPIVGGADTMTLHWTGTTSSTGLYAFELSRIAGYDVGATGSGTSSTATTGSFTTTHASDVVVSATIQTGTGLSAGTNYTLIGLTATYHGVLQDGLVGPKAQTTSAGMTASTPWGIVAASFF